MPTSRLLLSMTRGMTGVISRIKLPAVVDPSSVSLVPRTAKSFSIWTVSNRPQQRHKQALHFGSAPPFTFLCIPLHGSSVCHPSNPPKPRIGVFPINTRVQILTSIGNTNRAVRIRLQFSLHHTRATFSSRQNQNQKSESDYAFWAVRILGQRPTLFSTRLRSCCLHPSSPGVGELTECGVGRRAVTTPRPSRSDRIL